MEGVCVFDLDNTLGDFRSIDYFGLLTDPTCLLGFPETNISKKEIESYDIETKEQLRILRDTFEEAVEKKKYNKHILRPKLKEILTPLVKEYKKQNILGFIIYSNNGNIYSLEYAGRLIQKIFHEPNLFLHYLERGNSRRDQYDKLDRNGYPTKTFNTIKKLVPTVHKVLFMDDIIHDDLMNESSITYIHVNPYVYNFTNDDLNNLWDVFQTTLENMENFKEKFMKLYHVTNILHIQSMEDMKDKYIKYSNSLDAYAPFSENITDIKNKISHYLNSLNISKKKGGTRRYKTSRKKAHKKKYENTIE